MEQLRNHFFRRRVRNLFLVPAVLGLFLFAGCDDDDDDDDNGPTPTQTTMSGSLAGGTIETGTLDVTIQSGTLAAQLRNQAAPTILRPAGTVVVAATGVVDLEGLGGQVSLGGTYNTDTDSLFLSGSGYTLEGRRSNTGAGQVIEGLYTGPNGNGAFFVLAGAGQPLQSYCGTYTSTALADSGFFQVTVRGTSLTGFAISKLDANDIIRLYGDATGNGTVLDIEIQDPTNPGGAPLAEGTWDTSTDIMTGTYGYAGDTGTWEMTICD